MISNLSSTSWSSLISNLTARGLIHSVTSPKLLDPCQHTFPLTLYTGIDPTADSPHIGNLLPLSVALRFLMHGHNVITLIGGATGGIGDPTGRSSGRVQMDNEQLSANEHGLTKCIRRLFESGIKYATRKCVNPNTIGQLHFVNNNQWFKDLSFLQVLDIYGRHCRVSSMLNRDSVKSRIDSDSGLSFTEFSYQLMQAIDFSHLYKHYNCQLQVGGSDQWGNIVAGLDLIRRLNAQEDRIKPIEPIDDEITCDTAFGLTLPLITTVDGSKFGKSAGNAIWLDPNKTSVLDFYQFWLRVGDQNVMQYLLFYTFLPINEIHKVCIEHQKNPELRYAQRVLADEVTELVHSVDDLKRAQVQTRILYSNTLAKEDIEIDEIVGAFQNDPRLIRFNWVDGITIAELFTRAKITRSLAQAQKMSKSGALYINQEKVVDAHSQVVCGDKHLIQNRFCVLRTGKLNYHVLLL